jgi:hypothetical protein
MWTTEHSIETSATPEAIWQLWSDVRTWKSWNADVERVDISGEFAAGSTIKMTPIADEPIELLITEASRPNVFVDQAEFPGLIIRTIHRVGTAGGGRSRVTYRMEISGPDADSAGPDLGPQISGDFPDTLAALVAHAER